MASIVTDSINMPPIRANVEFFTINCTVISLTKERGFKIWDEKRPVIT